MKIGTFSTLVIGLLFATGAGFAQTIDCSQVAYWDPQAIYSAGDGVTYDGNLYVAQVDIHPADNPDDPEESPALWELVAACDSGLPQASVSILAPLMEPAKFSAAPQFSPLRWLTESDKKSHQF